jgi:hypothetical protein
VRNGFVAQDRTCPVKLITVPFCDCPGQSVAAAVAAGLLGGAAGVAFGLGLTGVALLAGVLGGLGDIGFHLVRRDDQFREALGRVRR